MENQNQYLTKKEIVAIVSVVVFLFPVVVSYFKIQTEIALIRQSIDNINNNHTVHIQDTLQEIKEIKVKDAEQDKQSIELQKQVLVILEKLSK